MLVSPAEPRQLRELGNTSSQPERWGADFLLYSKTVGMVGVQRKEINDLVASIDDDRLAREIPLLQRLDMAIILIEGRLEWTDDGHLFTSGASSRFTRAQYQGILWSLSLSGLTVGCTTSTTETIEYLLLFSRWLTKSRHTGLLRRTQKAGRDEYGIRTTRAQQIFTLQSFDGVGYERARAIVDFYGGLPLAWTAKLDDVPGIGAATAARLGRLLPSLAPPQQ